MEIKRNGNAIVINTTDTSLFFVVNKAGHLELQECAHVSVIDDERSAERFTPQDIIDRANGIIGDF